MLRYIRAEGGETNTGRLCSVKYCQYLERLGLASVTIREDAGGSSMRRYRVALTDEGLAYVNDGLYGKNEEKLPCEW